MTNPRMQDVDHLRNTAYNDASKLNARIEFWQLYGEPRDAAFARYFDRFDPPNNANILDLGCGPAHYWQWGLENNRIPHDWSMTLTDLSPGMIEEAKRNVAAHDHDFSFELADVCDLRFEDNSFDIVTANYMLYHASSQDKALAEISRVLKPGGRLYAATNSTDHITEFLELQKRFIIDKSQLNNVGLSHDSFTLENGGAMIEPHFSNVETIHDNSICEATDLDIVTNYAQSMDADLDQQPLRQAVEAEITANGYFKVTRASGIFIAQK
jgi:ubiquinone/menaquinone biosynthesis C-methylase UbiE